MDRINTNAIDVKAVVKRAAEEAGFDVVGFAPAADSAEHKYFPEWISAGYAGEMKYMAARDDHGELKRGSLARVAPWARSVVVCAINYNTDHPRSTEAHESSCGWISRYAWSREDYHDAVLRRLKQVEAALQRSVPADLQPLLTRSYVDTGPIVERVYAKYAGVGWIGKNTCIINQKKGSWLFLGVILTSLDLVPDMPAPDRCGSCTRCIDACPTDALIDPVSTRLQQMHFISHDRKTRIDSRESSRRNGSARFRLRHLPGRLPVESQSARVGSRRVPTTFWTRQPRSCLACRNLSGRISRGLSRIADPPHQAFRIAAQCSHCFGQ